MSAGITTDSVRNVGGSPRSASPRGSVRDVRVGVLFPAIPASVGVDQLVS